jgi:hypothetical protein
MIGVDHILRIVVVVLACLFIIRYASLYEEEYSRTLIDLYVYPWWRILLVFLLIASAVWCPAVSIIIALLAFFYLSDMNTLLAPLSA